MKKILKKSLHILCTTLGIIPFMLSSCNYLAVDEYFNDLTPLDSSLPDKIIWNVMYGEPRH